MPPHDIPGKQETTTRSKSTPGRRRWMHPIVSWRAARREVVLAEHRAELGRAGRQAQADLIRSGYHLGPAPYGYHALPVPVVDATGQVRMRRRLHRDPATAHTVHLIFHLRGSRHRSYAAIARRLIIAAVTPPGYGPDGPRPWTPDAVRRIVTNPVYMGWQVWGRTSGGRRTDPAQWVICVNAHEPLVTELLFTQAQNLPGSQPTFMLPIVGWGDPGTPPQPLAELP